MGRQPAWITTIYRENTPLPVHVLPGCVIDLAAVFAGEIGGKT